MGMYWLRRGFEGPNKRVEGPWTCFKQLWKNINAEDNLALAA